MLAFSSSFVWTVAVKEIEARFSALYGEKKTIDDLGLDCVIMAPDMLEPLKKDEENS